MQTTKADKTHGLGFDFPCCPQASLPLCQYDPVRIHILVILVDSADDLSMWSSRTLPWTVAFPICRHAPDPLSISGDPRSGGGSFDGGCICIPTNCLEPLSITQTQLPGSILIKQSLLVVCRTLWRLEAFCSLIFLFCYSLLHIFEADVMGP